ncbi:MBL fold metallo-hydrolase [Hydromonas duriensis]|uniref:Glyoxylase-like metal-dependent hydrolase (Beta-lactamase superfamily II) n=1 Tax=Hydromonas duriensis TaxID=1527608 RepID=A0A4V3DK28_9BURK|nr:MBL fold metallo-hydrolase [Hydromonas duriensis]TDR32493.1 glyoxylase-like metal-dependent hydrolase (beta-lactamase superfamily II) [Hydromonas duriensis]
MQVFIIPVTPFQQNCSLIVCDRTKEAAVVDPGGDIEQILAQIKQAGATVTQILLTHGHLDHAAGAPELASALGDVPIIGPHIDDTFWLDSLTEQSARFGFGHAKAFAPTVWLNDNDTVQVGDYTLSVILCPGHTPGHVVFYSADLKLAWVGDVLFKDSIGRTDFPRGNHADLIHSIKNKLLPLGDDVQFIPGHGPTSTFGRERVHNPYLIG